MGSPLPGKVSFSSGESLFLFRGKSLILPLPGKVSSFRGKSLPAGESHLSPRAWGVRLRAGVCWACVAAGSGFVVKPQASRALVGCGGPLGLGGPAARPTGWAGLAALWEIKKFFGGPRGCIPRNEIS